MSMSRATLVRAAIACAGILALSTAARADDWFEITVRDAVSLAPVGCASLKTVNAIPFTSDVNGEIAFYEPGLMDQALWFDVAREGYCSNAFNFASLTSTQGGSGTVDLYAIDGSGICAHPACAPVCPGASCPAWCQGTPDPGTCAADDYETRLLAAPLPTAGDYDRIEVVDVDTGRGVPAVELRSPRASFWTDSAGNVAYFDLDALGQNVTFEVSSHGYELASGAPEVTLATSAGGYEVVSVRRVTEERAERLYRVTGAGIYRDSVLLGLPVPIAHPLLNAKVMGQDTTQSTVYQGKAFFAWGDTTWPISALGNFKASGATADLPGFGGLDAEVGVNLDYFVDAGGGTKGICPSDTVPNPPGVTGFLACWLAGLATADAGGTERLYASYALVASLGDTRERGIVRWNDATERFEKQIAISDADIAKFQSHPFHWKHGADDYLYYPPWGRVPATEASLLDPATWETFTALEQGSLSTIERDGQGNIVYSWKTGTAPLDPTTAINLGVSLDEAPWGLWAGLPELPELHLVEPNTGEALFPGTLSLAWNDYRRRFVGVVQQALGTTSLLGEIWYLESDTPMGPEVYARKIVTHDDYTFYNVRSHPFYDKDGGREIFFEGTYTSSFSTGAPTPRYDYNQEMYKLDLDGVLVTLPVPVYDLTAGTVPGTFVTKDGLRPGMAAPPAPFMALDREVPGAVPVVPLGASCRSNGRLDASGTTIYPPLFWGLPTDFPSPPAIAQPLYEFTRTSDGKLAYSVAEDLGPDWARSADPLVLVFRNPISVTLPVTSYLAPLIADAGPDQCVTESAQGAGYDVHLDGAASSDSAGTIVSYDWARVGGPETATGPAPVMHLPAGNHPIRLTTTDDQGKTHTDTVVVSIAARGPCGASETLAGDPRGSWPWAVLAFPLVVLMGWRASVRR